MNLSYEGPQGLQVRVGLTHISQQFANTENYRGTAAAGYCEVVGGVGQTDCGLFGEIPALTLYNASISYAPKGQKMRYYLSGENLGNKQYFTYQWPSSRPRSHADGGFALRILREEGAKSVNT